MYPYKPLRQLTLLQKKLSGLIKHKLSSITCITVYLVLIILQKNKNEADKGNACMQKYYCNDNCIT